MPYLCQDCIVSGFVTLVVCYTETLKCRATILHHSSNKINKWFPHCTPVELFFILKWLLKQMF
jgi:hypothetical protein